MADNRKGKQVTVKERNTSITVVADVSSKLKVKVEGGRDAAPNNKSRK